MNCDQVEDLLPRFVEGALTREESLPVKEHLASCERCRTSWEIYAHLEDSLLGLKGELPSPKIISDRVMRQLGLGKRKKLSFGTVWNIHVLTSLIMIAGSTVFFLKRVPILRFLTRSGIRYIEAFKYITDNTARWIIEMAGSETWVLFAVYLLLTSLIILTGGLLLNRFVRR